MSSKRTPRQLIRSKVQSQVTISYDTLESIEKDLRCPICLDVMNNVVLTECCLNRFCKECIVKYLQQLGLEPGQRRECPTCKHPTNHRKLKSDGGMDKFINMLQEERQRNPIESLDVKNARKRYQEQVEELKQRSKQRRLFVSYVPLRLSDQNLDGNQKLVFSLFRDVKEHSLSQFPWRQFRIAGSTTVGSLRKFVLVHASHMPVTNKCSDLLPPVTINYLDLSRTDRFPAAQLEEYGFLEIFLSNPLKRSMIRLKDDSNSLQQLYEWSCLEGLPFHFIYRSLNTTIALANNNNNSSSNSTNSNSNSNSNGDNGCKSGEASVDNDFASKPNNDNSSDSSVKIKLESADCEQSKVVESDDIIINEEDSDFTAKLVSNELVPQQLSSLEQIQNHSSTQELITKSEGSVIESIQPSNS